MGQGNRSLVLGCKERGFVFEYNPAFLGGRLDPFPLVASVKSPASRRPIMGDKETKLYRKLPPFLADSLPDAWGNQVFECWRIQNDIRNQEITPLEICPSLVSVVWEHWSLSLNHPALESRKS